MEHHSIRTTIRYFREAKIAGIALNGPWLKGDGWGVSGHSEAILELFRHYAPNVPIVDKRTVPEATLFKGVISGPMVNTGPFQLNPSSYSDLPIPLYLSLWEKLGAKVHWGSLKKEEWENNYVVASWYRELTNG